MPKKDTIVADKATTYQAPDPAGGVKLETFIPWKLVKRGVKKQVITPLDAPEQFQEEVIQEHQIRKAEQDSPLIKALGQAHFWTTLLESGKVASPADVAQLESMDVTRVRELLRLTLLSPDLVEMILENQQPRCLSLEFLLRNALPRDWVAQRVMMSTPQGKTAAIGRSATTA